MTRTLIAVTRSLPSATAELVSESHLETMNGAGLSFSRVQQGNRLWGQIMFDLSILVPFLMAGMFLLSRGAAMSRLGAAAEALEDSAPDAEPPRSARRGFGEGPKRRRSDVLSIQRAPSAHARPVHDMSGVRVESIVVPGVGGHTGAMILPAFSNILACKGAFDKHVQGAGAEFVNANGGKGSTKVSSTSAGTERTQLVHGWNGANVAQS